MSRWWVEEAEVEAYFKNGTAAETKMNEKKRGKEAHLKTDPTGI